MLIGGLACSAGAGSSDSAGGSQLAAGAPAAGSPGTAGLASGGNLGTGTAGETGGGNTGSAGTAATAGSGGTTASAGSGGSALAGSGGTGGTSARTAAAVSVDASGKYSVSFAQPPWTFAGALGAPASGVNTSAGTDAVGAYHETSFTYVNGGTRNARIRAYDQTPVVIFGETNPVPGTNTRNFPKLSTLPSAASYHLTYQEVEFGPYTFSGLTPDSPWVFFDGSANTFILSAASHFMNAQTTRDASGNVTVGIASQIAMLPANFEQTTVLAADTGINQTYQDWGEALLKLTGKKRNPSDLSPDLERLGYWTDNKATYYYSTEAGKDYETTLKDVKSYFAGRDIALGYMQLDRWWYPKGSANTWKGSGTNRGGEYLYEADKTLFPSGLGTFQQALGLPLVTHARWIDPASPYRTMYKMSANVSTDPAFWKSIAAYAKSNGVSTYEQDWLNEAALPSTANLTDQDAFTDNMAQAMSDAGLNIQYCMPLPRHYLQSTKYQNLVTTRVSTDGFVRERWRTFFYGSRLAWSLGLWPWTDVFMSSEHDNLLLSTLSAGMTGVGDPIGSADKASIMRSIRADGVLIKPDQPILLLDRSIVAEAQGKTGVSIATTYSQHTGGRTSYVFGFTDTAGSMSFTPAELGYAGSVYVLDVNHGTGRLLTASQANTDTISDTAYYIVAPLGPSGIAFLGEQGKLAAAGKKRISDWSDDGTLTVSVAFAAHETAVTLTGYAPTAPIATASTGSVSAVQYDTTQKRFTLAVMPSSGSATVKLHL